MTSVILVRVLLCSLLGVPLQRHRSLRIDPASRTVVDIYPLGAILEVRNDTYHVRGLS